MQTQSHNPCTRSFLECVCVFFSAPTEINSMMTPYPSLRTKCCSVSREQRFGSWGRLAYFINKIFHPLRHVKNKPKPQRQSGRFIMFDASSSDSRGLFVTMRVGPWVQADLLPVRIFQKKMLEQYGGVQLRWTPETNSKRGGVLKTLPPFSRKKHLPWLRNEYLHGHLESLRI